MAKTTMTVRIDGEMRDKLDAIAASQDRDRSYVVNEALEAYVELQEWQLNRIRQGLKDAEEGRFVPQAEVDRFFNRFRRK